MPVSIVNRALLLVREDAIGFGRLFERVFRLGVVGVLVRVELDGAPAIGLLDVLLARLPIDTEHFVEIAFRRATQNESPD